MLLQARSDEDPAKAAIQIQAVIHDIDPRVSAGEVTTVQAWIDQALARERVLAFLSVILGGIAVVVSIGAAACAALIPAWKATRTDPAAALRYE